MRWKIALLIFGLVSGVCWLLADVPNYPVNRQPGYPEWWYDYGLVDEKPTAQPDNHNLATIGQLKNMATSAAHYLDTQLTGIGGSNGTSGNYNYAAIDIMVSNFTLYPANSTANYQAVQIGVLKAVAKPFYDRLIAIGYNTTAQLKANGYPSTWSSPYPWTMDQNTGSNTTALAMRYQYANLGQLKMVFSFDLKNFSTVGVDANNNTIPDTWEFIAEGGNMSNLTLTNYTYFSSTGSTVPDVRDADPNSPPANLTVSIIFPANGTSPP